MIWETWLSNLRILLGTIARPRATPRFCCCMFNPVLSTSSDDNPFRCSAARRFLIRRTSPTTATVWGRSIAAWSQIFSSKCPILIASRIGVRRRSTTFTVRRFHRSGSRCAPARGIDPDAAEFSRALRAAARRTERRARSPPSSRAE